MMTPEQTVHYPSFCKIFLDRASKLEELAAKDIAFFTAQTSAHTHMGDQSRKVMTRQLGRAVAQTKLPLLQLGWSLAAAAPLPTRAFCRDKADAALLTFADQRAGHLSGLIGIERVAMVLPHSLRTSAAASFMHARHHYAMTAVIEKSLDQTRLSTDVETLQLQ